MVAESLDMKPRIAPYDPTFYTGDVRTAFEWLHEHEPIGVVRRSAGPLATVLAGIKL